MRMAPLHPSPIHGGQRKEESSATSDLALHPYSPALVSPVAGWWDARHFRFGQRTTANQYSSSE